MRPPKKLYLIVLCLIFHWQAFAGEIYQTSPADKFLKSIYTTKEGLPQNSPTGIVQTKDGYLWIATFGGLARFDGLKFTVFTTSDTPNLVNSRITALYEDRYGTLWIGSEDGDVMNYKNGAFNLVKRMSSQTTVNTIVGFYLDENDLLWIAFSSNLVTYDLKTAQFTEIENDRLIKKRFPLPQGESFHYDFIKPDNEGNLWIGTSQGLIKHRDGNFTQITTDNGLPDNHAYSIAFNQDGGIWVCNTRVVGLFKDGVFSKLAEIDYEGELSFLNTNRENHLFFASKKFLFEVIGSEVKKYDITGIGTDGYRHIFFDKEDNLWLGANLGLVKLRKREINVFSVSADKVVVGLSSIIESADKSVWISSGQFLLRSQNGIIKQIAENKKGNYFVSFSQDKNNTVWASTYNGIYKIENNELTRTDIVGKAEISPIYVEPNGTIWFSQRPKGLFAYKDGKIEHYTTENGLANDWVSYITQDRKGAIWIGTKGGLSRFEDGKFTNYTTQNGLANDQVRDIFEDEEGAYWIGTYGGGIARLKDDKIVSITLENGLAENIASRLLLDDYGIFWVLGNKGIYTVSKKSLNDFADGKVKRVYCIVYDERDGMIVGEGSGGNQPAGWKTSDGKMWFPMVKGGVIINPKEPNKNSPPVFIESAFLNKEKVNLKEKLVIQPGQDNLEISYTAVSFYKPDQVQFRYKLENYDSDWQDIGSRRIAYYPYLPPGTYTFKVIATNGNDIWNEVPASLEIEVRAPFYRTWWFLVLSILALILLMFLAFRWRLSILHRRRLQQEEFARQLINTGEAERNRIAGELHDGLGQNLLIIRNWTLLLLKQVPEDAKYRKQLEEIVEVTAQSLEDTRNMTRNLRPQHLQRFGLTETIRTMLKQIGETSPFRLRAEIDEIDNLFTAEEELSIYRIVQESLNNTIKHSEANNVEVIISRIPAAIEFTNAQDRLMIKINDDGKGFDLQNGSNRHFGLDNIYQRVQLLRGKYSIKSSVGKGTTILIYLNIKDKANERKN